MNIDGTPYRTIWSREEDPECITIIDQTKLPHSFVTADLRTLDDAARAIQEMRVRGAGLIGAAAGYGMYLAALRAGDGSFDSDMRAAAETLIRTRPTAKNLEWAVRRQLSALSKVSGREARIEAARKTAGGIADEDADFCRRIGEHGVGLLETIRSRKQEGPVRVLTHCNAGWLAFVDYGSATSPVYAAFNAGIPVHVWVDETRPRNQGAGLTAWELGKHGVPHDIIVDNAGGHLMQHGMVDIVIVGADRVTAAGDAANKIGTYLKALAAADNNVPFYVAFPSSTVDWEIKDGVREIPIEERSEDEVRTISGRTADGRVENVLLCPDNSRARNFGFDVTPARLITGLLTERGICGASAEGIASLYPEGPEVWSL
jgi:methylthioribose-1-phosphate isomerase